MWQGRGVGAKENTGWEGYGRQEKEGGKQDSQGSGNWGKVFI